MGLLRLFLAFCVVFHHLGLFRAEAGQLRFIPDGLEAVWIFYVISGFYMALILNEKYAPSQNRLFWSNRFLRLWPTYLLSLGLLALTWALTGFLHLLDTPTLAAGLHHYPLPVLLAAGLSNLSLVGLDIFRAFAIGPEGQIILATSEGADPGQGAFLLLNPPAFTLSLELVFYAIAPFVVRSWRRTLALFALGLLWHGGLLLTGHYSFKWFYCLFPSGWAFFALGGLLYHAGRRNPPRLFPASLWGLAVWAVAIRFSMPWGGMLWVAALAPLIPALFHLTRANRIDRLLGELSYPVYILHVPLLDVIVRTQPAAVAHVYGPVLVLATAWLVYQVLERPIDDWRQARLRAPAT